MTDTPRPMPAIEHRDLPLSDIRIEDGFNPRGYFNEPALDSLTESVKSQGVLQSILVRPAPDGIGYTVVAGERRFRAAQRATLSEIPARIAAMDDHTALAAATAENGEREDISVAEEARLAKRALALSDGQHDEAAKLLGWKKARLKARLMLLHATDAVLDALEQRTIGIGHAELLATLPPHNQGGTLTHIIDNETSVQDLKGQLGSFTREMARARFDTSGCQGCPFNSSTQSSLFDISVGPGRCSDHACWSKKTGQHVDAVIAEQKETVPAVYRDTDKDDSAHTILFADGASGVGEAQFNACKACEFYGAIVSTQPGREGAVTADVCFNVACNQTMIAAAKADAEAERSERKAGPTTITEQAKRPSDPSSGNTKQAQSSPIAKSKNKSVAMAPKAVTALADRFVRQQAVAESDDAPAIADALSIFGLFQMADTTGNKTIREQMTRLGNASPASATTSTLFAGLLAADQDARDEARAELVAHLLGDRTSDIHGIDWQAMAKASVSHRQPDLSQRFVMDADFLRAHTKSGMESLLRDARFDTWLDARDGEGAFNRLLKKKVDEIVATVFPTDGERFDFAGFVPASVAKRAGLETPAA